MQKFNGVTFDSEPEKVTVYPSCVDVVTSCTETEVEDSMSGEKQMKFICDVERYEVHEYIQKLQENNANLQEQVTQAQVGLVEVYEMLLG